MYGDGGSSNGKYEKCWNTSVFNGFSAPVLKPDPQFDPNLKNKNTAYEDIKII